MWIQVGAPLEHADPTGGYFWKRVAPVAAKLRRAAPPWGKAFASGGRSAWSFVWERPKSSNSNCRAYVSFQGKLEGRRIKLVCSLALSRNIATSFDTICSCWELAGM